MDKNLYELGFRFRSGDKGDTVDISLFAPGPELYAEVLRQMTPERLHVFFGDLVKGEIKRYELPNLLALKFVLEEALDGGAASSSRYDNLGKCYGGNILRFTLETAATTETTAKAGAVG